MFQPQSPWQTRSAAGGVDYYSSVPVSIASLRDGEADASNDAADDGNTGAGNQDPAGEQRILIVDDEEPLREMLARFLQRSGYQVMTAADGLEALEICQDRANAISLVLLDMTMPRMDGITCAAELRQDHPGISIVLMSAYADNETLRRCEPLMDSYLAKPFQLEELRKLIVRLLAR